MGVIQKIFGTKNDRELKRLLPKVRAVAALEPELEALSDEELRAKTDHFRQRLRDGEALDDLTVEAFAVVREAAKRVLKMRHFDVQILGGIVLHKGSIAEMKTGEGKTLVATLPAYLNALPQDDEGRGRGVHIITVNDYLARRDREWMGPVYEFLGLTTGVIQHDSDTPARRKAYGCDLTFGTANEFGFDYLRDNLKTDIRMMVQRELNYAIIDEVDSILIDEARTPLIISGQVEKDTHRYNQFQPLVKAAYERQRVLAAKLLGEVREMDAAGKGDDPEKWWKLLQAERALPKHKDLLEYCAANKDARKQMLRLEGDLMRDKRLSELGEGLLFVVNEKDNNVEITEDGQDIFARGDPNLFEIPDLDEAFFEIDRDESLSKGEKAARKDEVLKLHEERSDKLHSIQQLVKAYTLFERDVEYVVHENEVVIVDEFTGRMMPGRRYSDGLHQALEAKEGVRIAKATQTVATITLQNYFRLYNKLAGMTGTAATEAAEFLQIYKLGVNVIPTNRPMIRVDYPDVIYRTEEEKYEAAVDEISDCRERGQPALVGTVSVEASERLSAMLKRKKIPHEVLNAKNHAKEAEIVAQAGQRGQVTIATNMAGRGTDIVLGEGVRELGGLHIIGTERHESRRIDNQLRGRAGRQGDPGSSRFYLSLEDNLMRLFASDRVSAIMERLGMQRGEAIEAGIVTRAIENAQSRVEQRNFGIRKNLLEYDDVNNQQRKVIYELRRNILSDPDIHGYLMDMVEDLVRGIVASHTPEAADGQWDFKGMEKQIVHHFLTLVAEDDLAKASSNEEDLVAAILEEIEKTYAKKEREVNDAIASMSAEQRGLIEHIFGAERSMAGFVRVRMVEAIDRNWMDVLHSMDQLKEGIHLRGYGQKNPLIEYKKEGYSVFEEAMGRIREEVVDVVFRSRFVRAEAEPAPTAIPTRETGPAETPASFARPETATAAAPAGAATPRIAIAKADQARFQSAVPTNLSTNSPEAGAPAQSKTREAPRVGRNDPCPCGSGLKYKKCHGK